ncbi:hypothetical protein ACQKPX_22500 [Photobacterium sp. DNB23_23_1]
MLAEFRVFPIADWRLLYQKMDLAIKGGINRLEQMLISVSILAGYDRGNGKVDEVSSWLAGNFSWIPSSARNRYVALFGEEVFHFLAGVESPEDMGDLITGDIYSAEIDYLISEDYVVFAEDILWRHHQLGWSLSAGEQTAIYRYLSKTWIDQ